MKTATIRELRHDTTTVLSWVAVLLLMSLSAAALLGRTAMRYWAIHKLLSTPEARQRMSVVPKHRIFSASAKPVQIVDLGYATFDFGFAEPVSRNAIFDGAGVRVSNAAILAFFLPPYDPEAVLSSDGESIVSGSPDERSKSAIKNRLSYADLMQAEIRAENQQLASVWELAWMTKRSFQAYFLRIVQKKLNPWGCNEVVVFETPYSKGMIRIGKNAADRRQARIHFTSLDLRCAVGGGIVMTDTAAGDVAIVAESVARSFRFTVKTMPAEDKIAQLIAHAGIQKKENSPAPIKAP